MVPLGFLFVVFISATSVAAQISDAEKMTPALALFFYYGYLNEWGAHQGWTTIGGRGCRDGPKPCNFDEFLDATTRPGGKGGYRGGQRIDDTMWNVSIKRIADSLQGRGLRGTIDWDPQKLVIGAGPDRDVWDDHITYVLNAFTEDRARIGHQQNYHNKAIEALTLMAEINAGPVSKDLTQWFKDEGFLTDVPEAYKEVRLPAEGDPPEGALRTIIDLVNFFKTWVYEMGRGDHTLFADLPKYMNREHYNRRLGEKMARLRLTIVACKFGPLYPEVQLPQIDTSPVNWGPILTPSS